MTFFKYIITYSIVVFVVGGMIFLVYNASKYDYRFVNKCNEAGGHIINSGDINRCVRSDNKIIIME